MEPLYAVAGILGIFLASLAAAYFAGRASLEDDLRAQRERAERAEALAETRKAELESLAQRQARDAEGAQQAVNDRAARIDVAHQVGPGDAPLRDALADLLRPHGGGGGPEAPAGQAGKGGPSRDG